MHPPRSHPRLLAFALAAALVAPAAPMHAQRAAAPDRARLEAAVDSVVNAAIADGRAAGFSVAVVRGRDTLLMKAYGKADLELDVPTPPRAVYEIGSMTKQFTAAAILQLAEQGKLSLDDEVTKHLPDFDTQGHRVTLRRLMDHTSGIKSFTEIQRFGTLSVQSHPRDSLVALFEREPFDFAPGEALVYNNSAYFLLGLVIEKVSGKGYAEYVRENLFQRAGMPDSRYCSERQLIPRRVHGYDLTPGGLVRTGYVVHTYPYAAGSLCSSAADLVAWNQALHGGRILGPAMYRELITPGTLNDGTRVRYAKGLVADEVAGRRVINHGGAIDGFLSDGLYFPEDGTIIIALTNTLGPARPEAVTAAVVAALYGRPAPRETAYMGDLAQFAGTYRGVGRGRPLVVTFAAEGGALTLTGASGGRPTPLRYVGEDTWELPSGSRYTFIREGGRVARVRADQRILHSVLTRQ